MPERQDRHAVRRLTNRVRRQGIAKQGLIDPGDGEPGAAVRNDRRLIAQDRDADRNQRFLHARARHRQVVIADDPVSTERRLGQEPGYLAGRLRGIPR